MAGEMNDSVTIVDISNPKSMQEVGMISNATYLDNSRRLFISGDYAFVGTLPGRMTIVEISNKKAPQIVGYTPVIGSVTSIYVSGNYAYISYGNTVEIYDVSGLRVPQAEIGTAKITNLQVNGIASVNTDLIVKGGLTVGAGGLTSQGGISIMSPTSSFWKRCR